MIYIKKLIKSIKIVIITTTLPYIITIISSITYKLLIDNNINNFINNYLIFLTIIYYLITILFLIKKYKIKTHKLSFSKYYNLSSIGISISCILNMIIFKLANPPINNLNINIIILFLTSSLIGPIYEEIIFRHIFYNKLKKFNSTRISITINTIIFSIIHINIIKIIYSFILGLILVISYEKNKNIIASIIIHISANTISLFLTNYNKTILILSIILLIISLKINKDQIISK